MPVKHACLLQSNCKHSVWWTYIVPFVYITQQDESYQASASDDKRFNYSAQYITEVMIQYLSSLVDLRCLKSNIN